MPRPRDLSAEVRGSGLRLLRGGQGSPLLFLHGADGPTGWLPVLERLAGSFEVIAPDHPSFGRSPTPPWLQAIDDLAYFYLDYLAQEKLSGVHLVGFSIGGWIAMELAVRSTQRIGSLTLIGSAGIRVKGQPPADMFVMDRAEYARALYADPQLIDRVLAGQPTAQQADQLIGDRVAAARLCWQPRLFNPRLEPWLHRIDVPTRILWGGADRMIPAAYAGALRALIPGATSRVVPEAGHALHVERPDLVAGDILEFLNAGGVRS